MLYGYVDAGLKALMWKGCFLLCENFSCIYMYLYMLDIFHILQSFLTNIVSRECNVLKYAEVESQIGDFS
jgi:hypothetical protein